MYNIRYTKLAKKDLSDLFEKIAEDKPAVAVEYIYKLQSNIELLQTNPLLGIECKTKKINKDCRILIFENYLLFYQFKNDEIIMVRILNSKIDYKKKL